MKRRHTLLFTLNVVLVLCAACGAQSIDHQQQQYALNRQLIVALDQNDTEQAITLVKAGADPNTRYDTLPYPNLHSPSPVNRSPTALMLACGRNVDFITGDIRQFQGCPENTALIQIMLKHGANVNARDSRNNTALILATSEDRITTIKLLLQHGPNVNAQDSEGETPLIICTRGALLVGIAERSELVRVARLVLDQERLLLEHGANPNLCNNEGITALHYAIGNAYSDLPYDTEKNFVRLLMAHGADPKKKDKYGRTPLQLAKELNRPDLVRLLKQHGAK